MLRTIPNRTIERMRLDLETLIATRLYEICTMQGYVDNQDWKEAAADVVAQEFSPSVPEQSSSLEQRRAA